MKKFCGSFSIIGILALVLAAGAAWAQPGMGPGGGRGRGGLGGGLAYNRMYDPKTVETVSGEVVSVNQTTYGRRGAMGVHLTLKTDKETIPVHLGPARYVDKQGITLAAKDKIAVTGSRITFQGQPAIIAREVKKGGQVLTLRDAAGVPAWAGRRRQ
jgi:hypothetical protein